MGNMIDDFLNAMFKTGVTTTTTSLPGESGSSNPHPRIVNPTPALLHPYGLPGKIKGTPKNLFDMSARYPDIPVPRNKIEFERLFYRDNASHIVSRDRDKPGLARKYSTVIP